MRATSCEPNYDLVTLSKYIVNRRLKVGEGPARRSDELLDVLGAYHIGTAAEVVPDEVGSGDVVCNCQVPFARDLVKRTTDNRFVLL